MIRDENENENIFKTIRERERDKILKRYENENENFKREKNEKYSRLILVSFQSLISLSSRFKVSSRSRLVSNSRFIFGLFISSFLFIFKATRKMSLGDSQSSQLSNIRGEKRI